MNFIEISHAKKLNYFLSKINSLLHRLDDEKKLVAYLKSVAQVSFDDLQIIVESEAGGVRFAWSVKDVLDLELQNYYILKSIDKKEGIIILNSSDEG